MCGRYSLTSEIGELQGRFEFDGAGLPHPPRYNIAPTQPVLAVANGEGREASYMRWGLIPSWAKDASVGNRLINARAETVAERNSFPIRIDSPEVLGSGRWVLRVAEGGKGEEAHADCDEVGRTLCLRGTLGLLAEPGGRNRPILHHHYNRSQ